MKYSRQSRILRIIQEQPVQTHEQLVEILKEEGLNVTQATVSRDIKELGLIKTPSPTGGSMYILPNMVKQISADTIQSLGNALIEAHYAMNDVVLKTYPGMASAVCAFIDEKLRSDFIGSIAGDDTILIITHDQQHAEAFVKKLKNFFR